MSELDRVAQLLAARFERPGEQGRIVFWHDQDGQYADDVHRLVGADAPVPVLQSVALVQVEHTPFDLRYRMTRQEPDARFLVYMTGAQPALRDDWLLDLKLAYGPLFSADKLTMIATEVLPDAPSPVRDEWLAAMRQAPRFFDSAERVERLSKRLDARDDADKFRAKMVAVLVGLPMDQHSLQDIWRALLAQYADGDSSGIDLVERMGLGSFHWEGTHRIYRFPLPEDGAPTVKGFVLWLFDLAWHGFIADGHDAVYYGNIKRDYEGWLRDRTLTGTMQALAEHAEAELDLDAAIERMGLDELADRDVFDAVDRVLVDRLLEGLAANTLTDRQVQEIVAKRRTGLWHDRYEQRYEAISAASTLRRELADATGVIDSIDSPLGGMEAYT
ncbi:MAG: BREX-1 system phosphatase PglZ type A, partial [Bifidobacterium choerinum]